MMNIIKTAIVTIIISIISGLLVERFKNLAPRILCNIGRCTPIKLNNKKVYAYKVTVSNLSKKIVHELSLNIQSAQSSIRIADAKITKGLKFDSSAKDKMIDIFIPFLGKDDKFSVTVYMENYKQPTIVLHSPENFREIDSVEKHSGLSSMLHSPKNTNGSTSNIVKKVQAIFGNKKAIIAAVSIVLVVIVGILVKSYFNSTSPSTTQTSSTGTDANKSNADTQKPSGGTNKGYGTGTSAGSTNRNARRGSSTGGTSTNGENTPTKGTGGNTGTKDSTGGTSTNPNSNSSTGGAGKNTNTNSTTDGSGSASGGNDTKSLTNGSTNTKTSTDGSAGNANTTTGGTNNNTSK
ncbi:hypothetical protein CUB90_06775 [Clostridium sp. CT7]|uniref:hypothetical protein n=2 Tax=Clostridium TaxID=1485 RepID=UPI000825749E|nr:hypothetical protein [Clostridium sp. CT7]PJI07584.1 hypothetical protein CUB90_06775 [Clostridium sp. CT7]